MYIYDNVVILSSMRYVLRFEHAHRLKQYNDRRMTRGQTTCSLERTPGRGGTPIWNRRGCSSEILNLTPKGEHLGVAQAFCDP